MKQTTTIFFFLFFLLTPCIFCFGTIAFFVISKKNVDLKARDHLSHLFHLSLRNKRKKRKGGRDSPSRNCWSCLTCCHRVGFSRHLLHAALPRLETRPDDEKIDGCTFVGCSISNLSSRGSPQSKLCQSDALRVRAGYHKENGRTALAAQHHARTLPLDLTLVTTLSPLACPSFETPQL